MSKQDKINTPQKVPGEEGVTFINEQVLRPKAEPMSGTAKPLADQAAAMIDQDMRSFLQGTEQVLTIAIAKALAKITETDGAEGAKALEQCERLLTKLPKFASKIGKSAAAISKEFK